MCKHDIFAALIRYVSTRYIRCAHTICSPKANVILIGKFPQGGNSPKHFAVAKYIVPQGISHRRYITLAKRAYHATSAEVATPLDILSKI